MGEFIEKLKRGDKIPPKNVSAENVQTKKIRSLLTEMHPIVANPNGSKEVKALNEDMERQFSNISAILDNITEIRTYPNGSVVGLLATNGGKNEYAAVRLDYKKAQNSSEESYITVRLMENLCGDSGVEGFNFLDTRISKKKNGLYTAQSHSRCSEPQSILKPLDDRKIIEQDMVADGYVIQKDKTVVPYSQKREYAGRREIGQAEYDAEKTSFDEPYENLTVPPKKVDYKKFNFQYFDGDEIHTIADISKEAGGRLTRISSVYKNNKTGNEGLFNESFNRCMGQANIVETDLFYHCPTEELCGRVVMPFDSGYGFNYCQ